METTSLVLLLLTFTIPALLLHHYTHVSLEPNEPPLVRPKIPIIGHMLGLLRHGTKYLALLHDENPLPIFTINVFRQKFYVVNNASLTNAVQRAHKVLSFYPFEMWAVEHVGGMSKPMVDVLTEEVVNDFNKTVTPLMFPGPGLDDMYRKFMPIVEKGVTDLCLQGSKPLALHEWIKKVITHASGEAMHGPKGPLSTPEGAKAYWDFDNNIAAVVFVPAPWLLARKAFRIKNLAMQYFIDYFASGDYVHGSKLGIARVEFHKRHQMSFEDLGRDETLRATALLANTVPSSFWTVFNVYSRPELLSELRAEVSKTVATETDSDGNTVHILDIGKVRECSLLLSTFKETLRTRTESSNVRSVVEDMTLNNQFTLKKGGIVQIPMMSIHAEQATWGLDAREFKPSRFTETKVNPVSFRAFGGGTVTCPGRFFATTEVLTLVACLIMQYDLVPVQGKWIDPGTDSDKFLPAVRPPLRDVSVTVTPAEQFKKGIWVLRLTESEGKYDVLAN